MRRIARVDANQRSIVGLFRAMGALVQPTHMVGSGFPDLLICYHGTLALIEIKDGEKAKSRRKLTQFEVDWQEEWKEAPIYIVEGDEDVMRVVRKLHG